MQKKSAKKLCKKCATRWTARSTQLCHICTSNLPKYHARKIKYKKAKQLREQQVLEKRDEKSNEAAPSSQPQPQQQQPTPLSTMMGVSILDHIQGILGDETILERTKRDSGCVSSSIDGGTVASHDKIEEGTVSGGGGGPPLMSASAYTETRHRATDAIPEMMQQPQQFNKLFILGSGQDGGLPQFGARWGMDDRARRDPHFARLGPSLCLVSRTANSNSNVPIPQDASTTRALLIDVSPDIKDQYRRLLQEPSYCARYGTGASYVEPFDAIVLTHGHMGHYAGLVHFGREAANTRGIPLFGTPSMCAFLSNNAPWSQLVKLNNINLHCMEPIPFLIDHQPPKENETEQQAKKIDLWDGVFIRLYSVPHRSEYTDAVAVSINDKILYVPDIDDWNQWPQAMQLIESHEICLLDATFYDYKELPGRDLTEIPHPLAMRTVKMFAHLLSNNRQQQLHHHNQLHLHQQQQHLQHQQLHLLHPHHQAGEQASSSSSNRKRIILTHLNHSNPLCDPNSEQAKYVTSLGFEVAQEMMEIQL